MIKNEKLIVLECDASARLDKFVSIHFPHISRSLVVEAITAGNILVNDKQARKGDKLVENDEVLIITLLEKKDIHALPDNDIKLDIIYEDDDILVLNKLARIPVHPLKPDETGTLVNGLIAQYPSLSKVGNAPLFPAFVHRLDNDTSGVIIAAKNKKTYYKLRNAFQQKQVKKIYTALVHGDINKSGKIDGYMAHDLKDDRRMISYSERRVKTARRAITHYKPLKRFGHYTLLEVEIETGVMHQIRCQLAHIGHPVVGDKIYRNHPSPGDREGVCNANRHLLHAERIGIIHPATGSYIEFNAGLPDDMACSVNNLKMT